MSIKVFNNRDEYDTALKIAEKAHAAQKDKVGEDYIKHPLTVSSFCKTERGKIAAILHDVVEDSSFTLDDLRAAGIGEDIIVAVDCLTKRMGETLDNYYKRVASNDVAVEVKFADIRHNCDASRWPQEMKAQAESNAKKYHDRSLALFYLVGNNRARALMTSSTWHICAPTIEN